MPRPAVLAHRGASAYAYQNSLAAFRLAREMGADGIELDIHATTDGALVVHHDPALDGVGIIAAHSLAEVRRVTLPNGEPVPTLSEALVAAGDLQVWIEVKTLPARHDGRLLDAIASGPHPERYAVHGFDHRIITRLGALAPALRRGVLSASRPIDPLAQVVAAGAEVLWQESSMTDRDLVAVLHAAGKQVIAWTPNDPDDLARLAALGVDGLCSNYPDRARTAAGLPPHP
ncbi:MAG: glycerophosphodiester phosphodiesterase [Gemmatimonadales bacterium]